MNDENMQHCCNSCSENGVCDKEIADNDLSVELRQLSKQMLEIATRMIDAGYDQKGEELAGAAGIANQWAGAILEQQNGEQNHV